MLSFDDGSSRFERNYRAWFETEIKNLTDEIHLVSPSEWAELNRYLPQGVTTMPGYYDYSVTPYLKEIVNGVAITSPIREIHFKKASQVGATTGVLENAIGYIMRHFSSAPAMFMTTDDTLVKKRLSKNIFPMINQSNLDELIQSNDTMSSKKSGKTQKLIEWRGGGSLVPAGAKSASSMRQDSIQVLLLDEIDGYPLQVGNEGCPVELAKGRCKAYWGSRKIISLSTPKLRGSSKIDAEYEKGDKRHYFVPCRNCGEKQVLKFSDKNEKGEKYGIVWEMDSDGRLIVDSVRYKCKFCGHLHKNAEKTWMFNRGEWRPTKKGAPVDIRSYHLSSLYSPASMYPWHAVVESWLGAWDVHENRVRDTDKLQVFYNTQLGLSYEIRGNRVTFSSVSGHRRFYKYGEIPNKFAEKYCGSKILLLTCAIDVHDKHLDVAVMGWTRGRRVFVIDYFKFEGDATRLDDPGTWGKVEELIEGKRYIADDGYEYKVELTFVDASYNTDMVVEFCNQYEVGVFPILGRDAMLSSKASIKEWREFTTSIGTNGYILNVDYYKDRWSASLRRSWNNIDEQPETHFNAPVNMFDKQIKELTVEYKVERIETRTGKKVGHVWKRPSGSRNELWDLLIYNTAAMEMIAMFICQNDLKLTTINFPEFFDYIEKNQTYFKTGR